MIKIFDGITESMKLSKQSLDDLQEASIEASGNNNSRWLPKIVQMRQSLQLYWSQVAKFMQIECFQSVSEVARLQDATGPADLISAIQQLGVSAEKCGVKAESLVDQHDAFMRSFKARNIRFRGCEAPIALFTQSCDSLRAGLMDLHDLIDTQRNACATYQAMVYAHYQASMLGQFTRLGKQWQPYADKAKETHLKLKKLSNEIAGVTQPTARPSRSRCIIM